MGRRDFPNRRSVSIIQQTAAIATPPTASARGLAQACRCAQVAEEMRGQNTLVLDLTKVTPIVDYFVVTTGASNRQMRSLAEEVSRVLKEQGSRRLGVEGGSGNSWILYDYGDIVLHVFDAQSRALYDLEHLWADAPRIDWKAQLADGSPRHA